MKIRDYSCYDTWTVKSETENISNIIDKMVRLAAKITESYASDIVYDVNALLEDIADNYPHDKILFFRECGVTSFNTELVKIDNQDLLYSDYIQTWRLTYDPESGVTMLKRVDIIKGAD